VIAGIYRWRSLLAVSSFSNEPRLLTDAWPFRRFARGYRQRFHCPDLDQQEPIQSSDDLACVAASVLIQFFYGWLERRRDRGGRCWWHHWDGLDRWHCNTVHHPPATCSPCVLRRILHRWSKRRVAGSGTSPTDHRNTKDLREIFAFRLATYGRSTRTQLMESLRSPGPLRPKYISDPGINFADTDASGKSQPPIGVAVQWPARGLTGQMPSLSVIPSFAN